MSEPFLGQLMLASWNFAPKGWAMANGQLMAINQNQALFSLLGTTFGGNGLQNFALPNLQGRAPVHQGNTFTMGQLGGQETHTITQSETPSHNHLVTAIGTATGADPSGGYLGGGGAPVFNSLANIVALNSGTVSTVGGSQPHENRQPYLVMTWVIALVGIFPSQN
jgi:microcystin-dependent protein